MCNACGLYTKLHGVSGAGRAGQGGGRRRGGGLRGWPSHAGASRTVLSPPGTRGLSTAVRPGAPAGHPGCLCTAPRLQEGAGGLHSSPRGCEDTRAPGAPGRVGGGAGAWGERGEDPPAHRPVSAGAAAPGDEEGEHPDAETEAQEHGQDQGRRRCRARAPRRPPAPPAGSGSPCWCPTSHH